MFRESEVLNYLSGISGVPIERESRETKVLNKLNMLKQRQFNEEIFEEMCKIEDFCRENNVRHFFVKGLTLAHQLYECPEERSFGDMDLFIHNKDLLKFQEFLLQTGYKNEDNEELDQHSVIRHYIPIHLSAFKKGNVYLEIHIMPYYINTASNASLGNEKMDEFFKMKGSVSIKGMAFTVPEPAANALFLLDHFIKHITYGIRHRSQLRDVRASVDVELDKLDETVFFIEKYNLCFSDLLEVALKYNSAAVLCLAYKYIKEVFPSFRDDAFQENEMAKLVEEQVCKMPFLDNKITGKLYGKMLKDVYLNMENIAYFDELVSTVETTPTVYLKVPKKADGVWQKIWI